MLTFIHDNPVCVREGRLYADRKFHSGMQRYQSLIAEPLCAINPASTDGPQSIDVVGVPLDELGYQVLPLRLKNMRPIEEDLSALRDQIKRSTLVCGTSFGAAALARSLGKPYVAVFEYDLKTRLDVLVSERNAAGNFKTAYRMLCCLRDFVADIQIWRGAYAVHCNGYSMYEAVRPWARERLRFLDSRMSLGDVISEEALATRLAGRAGRPLRLIFSGRYEPMKGSLDAVAVAVECLKRGYDIELVCYGAGSLKDEMIRLAASSPRAGRISVNGPVPFPELVKLTRDCDVFVCCHVQADPSCTYVESFGAGLPIVGYANKMHRLLQADANAGYYSPVGDVAGVADSIGRLITDDGLLEKLSRYARAFAAAHCFEQEFDKRVASLSAILAEVRGGHSGGQRSPSLASSIVGC